MAMLRLSFSLSRSLNLLVGLHAPSGKILSPWFPTYFISWPHSKIWHKPSTPAINCSSEGVQITTDKIKNTSFYVLHPLYLHSYA